MNIQTIEDLRKWGKAVIEKAREALPNNSYFLLDFSFHGHSHKETELEFSLWVAEHGKFYYLKSEDELYDLIAQWHSLAWGPQNPLLFKKFEL